MLEKTRDLVQVFLNHVEKWPNISTSKSFWNSRYTTNLIFKSYLETELRRWSVASDLPEQRSGLEEAEIAAAAAVNPETNP